MYSSYKYNLTGIYWIKDEARYIPEYIEFHLLQGFDHFIFYDNGSTDGLHEVLEPYIKDGLVEIKGYPDGVGIKNAWIMGVEPMIQAGVSKWVHFHATDERLFSPSGENVVSVLDRIADKYFNVGGVAVPWTIINSSGHETRPEGLIIENFTHAQRDRMSHIKTVIRPEFTRFPNGNPHNFVYLLPLTRTVNELGNTVNGPFDPDNPMKELKLYHYLSYSKEEFEQRMNKGVLDPGPERESQRRFDADFQWELSHNPENFLGEDTALLKYVDPVRNALAARYADNPGILERINH